MQSSIQRALGLKAARTSARTAENGIADMMVDLLQMFTEGIDGFKGGLSAKSYMTITGAPTATATRDRTDIVAKGALVGEGELKSTRYFLKPE